MAEMGRTRTRKMQWCSEPKQKDALKNRIAGAQVLGVTLSDPEAQNPALVRALVQAGADVQYVREGEHSLEEIYFSLMRQGGPGTTWALDGGSKDAGSHSNHHR